METWPRGELDELTRFIIKRAEETVEFTFDYVDSDQTGDTLQTFITFANDLWDATIAPIPHDLFWVSWAQKILDDTVKMAALCERVHSPRDGMLIGLSVQVMFENQRGNGFAFVNQVGHLVPGDHQNAIIKYADTDSAALLVENGFGIVKALLGALATPQAIRRDEDAPRKLNKARAKKGKEHIRPITVIDVRASQQAHARRRSDGGWTMRPHWRRGHIRRLPNGRQVPIPPCCVNMETGIPIKPEYVVKI